MVAIGSSCWEGKNGTIDLQSSDLARVLFLQANPYVIEFANRFYVGFYFANIAI